MYSVSSSYCSFGLLLGMSRGMWGFLKFGPGRPGGWVVCICKGCTEPLAELYYGEVGKMFDLSFGQVLLNIGSIYDEQC